MRWLTLLIAVPCLALAACANMRSGDSSTADAAIGRSDVSPVYQIGPGDQPQAIPYRANMSVLDVMISAGGLTRYAAGNRAVIARSDGQGHTRELHVRLGDLLKDGDLSANMAMLPGDVLIVPQSYF